MVKKIFPLALVASVLIAVAPAKAVSPVFLKGAGISGVAFITNYLGYYLHSLASDLPNEVVDFRHGLKAGVGTTWSIANIFILRAFFSSLNQSGSIAPLAKHGAALSAVTFLTNFLSVYATKKIYKWDTSFKHVRNGLLGGLTSVGVIANLYYLYSAIAE